MTTVKRVKKAVIYVLRKQKSVLEVLVFDHIEFPDVNPQVPSGTVEQDELPVAAAKRELFEESGLKPAHEFNFLGSYDYFKSHLNQMQERHHFAVSGKGLLNEWTHSVSGSGNDKDLKFKFYWLPVETAKESLQTGLGEGLKLFVTKVEAIAARSEF